MAYLGIKPSCKLTEKITTRLSKIQIYGKRISTSDYHITLLRFDDTWPVDNFLKSIDIVSNLINDIDKFKITISDIQLFDGPRDKTPVVALVQSDQLKELREKSSKAFDENNIKFYKTDFPYNPHITLAYSEYAPIFEHKFSPINSFASNLILCGGDARNNRAQIYFPLPYDENFVSSQKERLVKVFNNSNEYLTQTIERRVNLR